MIIKYVIDINNNENHLIFNKAGFFQEDESIIFPFEKGDKMKLKILEGTQDEIYIEAISDGWEIIGKMNYKGIYIDRNYKDVIKYTKVIFTTKEMEEEVKRWPKEIIELKSLDWFSWQKSGEENIFMINKYDRNGYAYVNPDDGKVALIGEGLTYDSCTTFQEGYAIVERNKKYGFIDTRGNVLGEGIIFDWCGFFENGKAPVYIDEGRYTKKIIMDKKGRITER